MGVDGLSGVQKAAVLLITLGPERSADIFKHLKEEEIEELTLEIASFKRRRNRRIDFGDCKYKNSCS